MFLQQISSLIQFTMKRGKNNYNQTNEIGRTELHSTALCSRLSFMSFYCERISQLPCVQFCNLYFTV